MTGTDVAALNLRWSLTLVDGLAAAGVRHAVISPGSRSTPLVLACDRHPAIRPWVVVDERSAAFFALGLAKSTRQPVAVIGTSGSAPANWFPAVIEANYGAVPLVLISADRPAELRECGANQTIDQARLFGEQVRFFFDLGCAEDHPAAFRQLALRAAQAVDKSRWPLAGPVHLNVPLREPLVPRETVDFSFSEAGARVAYPLLTLSEQEAVRLSSDLSGKPGLIVCGNGNYPAGFPDAVAAFARAAGCPVLADPLSGLRFGEHDLIRVLARYDAFLRNPRCRTRQRPAWVLRFGAMPVSKSLQNYLAAQGEARHILVEAGGRWPDPLHLANELLRADEVSVCAALTRAWTAAAPEEWLAEFIAQEQAAGQTLETVAPPTERGVVQAMLRHLSAGATLFSGNSMPIREVDAFSATGAKALAIVANRGASGIDGNVSTLLGLAAGATGPVAGLLGDLTLAHDLGGLQLARGLDVILVVLNNGGGGIFSYLPQAGLENFERYWLTPPGLDFEQAARLYGWAFQRTDAESFEDAFKQALAGKGARLIEVAVDRETSVARHCAYWAALAGN